MEREHPEPAPLGDPRVEQLESAGCRIARVGVERLPRFFLFPVQALERLAGHVNLSANLHHRGMTRALQDEWNLRDGLEVLRDDLSHHAVAASCAAHEPTAFVGQTDRGTVDLDLGGVTA